MCTIDMTEKKPCRWGPLIRQASVLGRFKNKLRLKKLEWKRFYEQMWGPTHPTAESEAELYQEWTDSNHGSEGSSCSNYNSQYYDAMTPEEALELYQQAQIPTLQQAHYQPSRFQQEHQQEFAVPAVDTATMPGLYHLDSFDDSSAPLSVDEYVNSDTYSELLLMELERNQSCAMSVDSTGHMEMMRDTGDSSGSTIPMRPEERLQWFKKFFELGAEEVLTGPHQQANSGGRGWRVMVRIVCACRKLKSLLRRRKLERNSSGQVVAKKRCRGFGENRSLLYKGVRRRNGKWVSEIRVGQTNEKVWLGSYDTEKEAALAFDAGKYHCSSKRSRSFNFPDSPRLLGPVINLRDLSSKERKKTIQQVAESHVKNCASRDL